MRLGPNGLTAFYVIGTKSIEDEEANGRGQVTVLAEMIDNGDFG